MRSSIAQLISGMSPGGFFWFATPTKKDLLFRLSKQDRGPTRVLDKKAGPQKGAFMTIFDEPSQIEKMFAGTRILDVGSYGMTFENCQHEYLVINARKI